MEMSVQKPAEGYFLFIPPVHTEADATLFLVVNKKR